MDTENERALAVEALRAVSSRMAFYAADVTAAKIESGEYLDESDWRNICEALAYQIGRALHDDASRRLLQKARKTLIRREL